MITKAIHHAESALLLLIGVLTLAGAAEAIYDIYERRDVELQDLLLIFLYAEVLGMAGVYYESKQIPNHFQSLSRSQLHRGLPFCKRSKSR